MDPLWLVDFILHIDTHLAELIVRYPNAIYTILFMIVFLETGLVITPFLPGDSLLFAAGSFAALGAFNLWVLAFILFLAAVLGDTVNYAFGKYIGPRAFRASSSRFFNPRHLESAQAFYEKHGGKTIVMARFVPIIRTFAPFVAGIGRMRYAQFISYNLFGALLWVGLFVFGGYFFGTIPLVKENFSLVILAIIALSLMPLVIAYFRSRKNPSGPPHLSKNLR